MFRIVPPRLFRPAVTALLVFIAAVAALADVPVRGHMRNGRYVRPHMRSNPDGNFWNNWSTIGNRNPYTGQRGTKRTPPDGYGGSSRAYVGSFYGSSDDRSTDSDLQSESDSIRKPREYKQYKRPEYVADKFSDEQRATHAQLVNKLQGDVQGLTWKRYTPDRLESISQRIEVAARIQQLGVPVEWYHHTLEDLLRIELRLADVQPEIRVNTYARIR